MRLTKEQAIEKVYHECNLNSEDDDCIMKYIYKYKVLQNLSMEEINSIYDEIAKRLGFMKY